MEGVLMGRVRLGRRRRRVMGRGSLRWWRLMGWVVERRLRRSRFAVAVDMLEREEDDDGFGETGQEWTGGPVVAVDRKSVVGDRVLAAASGIVAVANGCFRSSDGHS